MDFNSTVKTQFVRLDRKTESSYLLLIRNKLKRQLLHVTRWKKDIPEERWQNRVSGESMRDKDVHYPIRKRISSQEDTTILILSYVLDT